jgi:hypothetical protein
MPFLSVSWDIWCHFSLPLLQRGEAKLLSEDWEGAVQDLKEAAQKSPQVYLVQKTQNLDGHTNNSSCILFMLAFPDAATPKTTPADTHQSCLLLEPSLF